MSISFAVLYMFANTAYILSHHISTYPSAQQTSFTKHQASLPPHPTDVIPSVLARQHHALVLPLSFPQNPFPQRETCPPEQRHNALFPITRKYTLITKHFAFFPLFHFGHHACSLHTTISIQAQQKTQRTNHQRTQSYDK